MAGTVSTIVTDSLSRTFAVRRKEEGLKASLRQFFWPRYESLVAVDQLSMEIGEGEIVGFLGPNGAGKTTTLKMLSGLIAPTSGTISVMGFSPFDRDVDFLRRISLVMGQKQNLWWDLPPVEAFAIHREMYEIPEDEFRVRLAELVEMLEISECIEIQTRQLSLGQRMRCELATALLHRPGILFLDEPTIGLDILMQKRIRQFLKDYHARFHPTIMLTSHYMEDVAALAQRVVAINRGRKVFDGPLDKLSEQARPERLVTVTFRQIPPGFDPARFGKVLKQESVRFTISMAREEVGTAAGALYATGEILDLIVEEPPLEDAIAHLFRSR